MRGPPALSLREKMIICLGHFFLSELCLQKSVAKQLSKRQQISGVHTWPTKYSNSAGPTAAKRNRPSQPARAPCGCRAAAATAAAHPAPLFRLKSQALSLSYIAYVALAIALAKGVLPQHYIVQCTLVGGPGRIEIRFWCFLGLGHSFKCIRIHQIYYRCFLVVKHA